MDAGVAMQRADLRLRRADELVVCSAITWPNTVRKRGRRRCPHDGNERLQSKAHAHLRRAEGKAVGGKDKRKKSHICAGKRHLVRRGVRGRGILDIGWAMSCRASEWHRYGWWEGSGLGGPPSRRH